MGILTFQFVFGHLVMVSKSSQILNLDCNISSWVKQNVLRTLEMPIISYWKLLIITFVFSVSNLKTQFEEKKRKKKSTKKTNKKYKYK